MNKSETTNENLKSFSAKITEAKTKLENSNLENVNNDIIEWIIDIQEIKKNMNNWKNDLTRYKNCRNLDFQMIL